MARTLESPTDAIIVDLEDAVAFAEKPAARETVRAWLKLPRGGRRGYVRVNALSTPFAFDDFAAVVTGGLDGIVLPKAETPDDLKIAELHHRRPRARARPSHPERSIWSRSSRPRRAPKECRSWRARSRA